MRAVAQGYTFSVACRALAGALALTGCGGPVASAPAAERVAAATFGPLEDVFLLSGEIEAVNSVEFTTPRTNGEARIQWLAEDGAEVGAGDVLIAYDTSSLTAGLEDKRLRLTQARIDLASRVTNGEAEVQAKRAAAERAEIEWEQARVRAAVPADLQPRRDWQEKQNALRRAAAAREKALLETQAAAAKARSEVEAGRAAFDKARRDLADAEGQLAALRVKAPRDGIFVVADHWNRSEARKLQAGDGVFMGQRVASLADLSELRVAARLSAVDEGRVRAGQEARCILDTYPDRVWGCRVEEVGVVAEEHPAPGFAVRVALERGDAQSMRPGMSVRVEVVRRRLPRALLVPRGALEREAGRTFARLEGGGRAEVRLDLCTPLACALASGLREGQRVALR